MREGRGSAVSWVKPPTMLDRLKARCLQIASSARFTAFTTVLTLYVLFGDDVRLVTTDRRADTTFDVLTVICFIFFAIEIFAHSVAKDDYLFSFFMVLDTIATATLIFDISTVSESLVQGDGGESEQVDGSMARASRASRAGTRAARVVRIIRLIRLVRIVKLYKATLGRAKLASPSYSDGEEEDEELEVAREEESRVGKKMSEMTTKKVIIIVLGMMGLCPLFAFDTLHQSNAQSKQIGADILMSNYHAWKQLKYTNATTATHNEYVDLAREEFEDSFLHYLYMHNPKISASECIATSCAADFTNRIFWIGGVDDVVAELPITYIDESTWNDRFFPQGIHKWVISFGSFSSFTRKRLSSPYSDFCSMGSNRIVQGVSLLIDEAYSIQCPQDLRFMERLWIVGNYENEGVFLYFDLRANSQFSAILNILTTLFICGILWWGAMAFSKVTDTLVLLPLERMIERVERIKANPMAAMYDDDKKKDIADSELCESEKSWWQKTRLYAWCAKRKSETSVPMETVVLETTIIKIGGLMALGFGEAGMEIISQNMQGGLSASVNAMIPGKKINGVFSFCDMRNFADTTEVLQDDIMVFVNTICSIIHPIVDKCLGAPNKNIGDTFLLVWRFDTSYSNLMVQKITDLALLAIIKVVAALNTHPSLIAYRTHRLLLQRMPNYTITVSFGVHVGWAIEGAIGSEFKIDASYLSPNINLACRVEALTKCYNVLILCTDAMVKLLSVSMANVCRLIDHVQLQGQQDSVRLYVVDLNTSCLRVKSDYTDGSGSIAQLRRGTRIQTVNSMEKRRDMKLQKLEPSYNVYNHFCEVRDIKAMRRLYVDHPEFTQKFRMAFLNFESGEWQVAKTYFQLMQDFLPGPPDGPCVNLLNYCKQYDYCAPKTWAGYRTIQSLMVPSHLSAE